MSESGPKAAPGGLAAKPDTRRHLTPADPHDVYMRQLSRRIRWLERHRNWWLRTEDGQAQREFLDQRDAA
jgi:hypothetical protein